jgi:hypothetical protein
MGSGWVGAASGVTNHTGPGPPSHSHPDLRPGLIQKKFLDSFKKKVLDFNTIVFLAMD